MAIRINEIFYSIQGESSRIGFPTIFIRLTGCPMRCNYCDTAYAFHEGSQKTIEDILKEIKRFPSKFITVTGGEPLAQKQCLDLLKSLCDEGYQVSLETGGGLSIEGVDQRVKIILDVKTLKSGEVENNVWGNLSKIKSEDEVKFVILDKEDFIWSKNIIKEYSVNQEQVLFSPVYGKLNPTNLSDWILQESLNVRVQLQLHKILWGEKKGV
jgi:7-carboxy-7-deazaguanine synthase